MARKLKPVDDSPICDPAYLKRIDPLWMPGKVGFRFWQDRRHRRDYLLWLAKRLRFRRMSDLYRLKLSRTASRHYGLGLVNYWQNSALVAVRDCFPQFDWKPWLFYRVPAAYWHSAANRREYLDWLGAELGFRRPEDWYRIRSQDIVDRHGSKIFNRIRSLYGLMRAYLPQLDWDRLKPRRRLTVQKILAWADAYKSRHGKWPTVASGKISESDGTWTAVNSALREGRRGLPGEASLLKLLRKHRGASKRGKTLLSERQILAWADAYLAEHGQWPSHNSGPIAGAADTWLGVDAALRSGGRGLGGNSSLARLLAKRRGKRNPKRLSPLTERQILAWADAHFAAHGAWPDGASGSIGGTTETWAKIQAALQQGRRAVGPGSSLERLLSERRGVRNHLRLPPLSEVQIIDWARHHFAKTAEWPTSRSGQIADAVEENWRKVDNALRRGCRGLPGGSSVAKLLRK